MKRYFLELAYLGTNFSGWQMQPNKITVQSTIAKTLSTIYNEPITCLGCGRTDSGVHASQFFLHFETTKDVPVNFLYRMNKMLSRDIVIHRIFECDKHARFDATYRAYEYFVHFKKSPFLEPHSFFFPYSPLDFEKMYKAFNMLNNYIEFKPFEKSKSDSKTSICRIYKTQISINEATHQMKIHIAANRFLRGMVRRIVGALIMVGKDKITLEEFKTVMDHQGTFSINISAPAQGLFLSEVRYENFCGI